MGIRDLEREKAKPADSQWHHLMVPAEERAEVPAIWVAELYSPSYFSSLERALAKQSWPREPGGGYSQGRELIERMRETRERDRGFVGLIGRFLDIDSRAFAGWDLKREKLPDGIDMIEVHAFVLAPALTAVVAACSLNASVSERLNTTLGTAYPPRISHEGGGRVLHTGADEGIAAVQAERARIHDSARRWLASRIPGIFATEGDGQLPLLGLLLTRKHHPIQDEGSHDPYLKALGLSDLVFDRVVSPELHGFKLDDYQTYSSRERDGLWTLAANYADAFTDEELANETGQERSAQSIANAMGLGAGALLVRLAITHMLKLKGRQMNRSRDIATSLHNGSRPASSIKKLRETVLVNSIDLSAMANGISSFTSDRHRYEYMVPTLWRVAGAGQHYPGSTPDETNKEVLAEWAAAQSESASKLVEDDSSLTQMLGVVASLTGSLSGIRMQRWAMVLGIASLIAAASAAVFAYLALHL